MRTDPFDPTGGVGRLLERVRSEQAMLDQMRRADPLSALPATLAQQLRDMAESSTQRRIREFRERDQLLLPDSATRAALAFVDSLPQGAMGALAQISRFAGPNEPFSAWRAFDSATALVERHMSEVAAQTAHARAFSQSAGALDAYRSLLERGSALEILRQQREQWAQRFGIPVLDSLTAANLALSWGRDGVERQMRRLGIDDARLTALLAGAAAELPTAHAPIKPARFLSREVVLSICLALFFFFLEQAWDEFKARSARAEAQEAKELTDKRFEDMRRLLEELVEGARQARDDVNYVVERIATLRREPQAGSKKLATIYPNQVVALIDADGKWIRVRYEDLVAEEEREGWVLKKYLRRVSAAGKQPRATRR
jgi:hypothetical protein